MTSQLINQKKELSQTVSVQEQIAEYQIYHQQAPELLNIHDLGFIENGTGKHQSNTVYGIDGVCPCEYAGQYKQPIKIIKVKNNE